MARWGRLSARGVPALWAGPSCGEGSAWGMAAGPGRGEATLKVRVTCLLARGPQAPGEAAASGAVPTGSSLCPLSPPASPSQPSHLPASVSPPQHICGRRGFDHAVQRRDLLPSRGFCSLGLWTPCTNCQQLSLLISHGPPALSVRRHAG